MALSTTKLLLYIDNECFYITSNDLKAYNYKLTFFAQWLPCSLDQRNYETVELQLSYVDNFQR